MRLFGQTNTMEMTIVKTVRDLRGLGSVLLESENLVGREGNGHVRGGLSLFRQIAALSATI
jgi:hypothetical protein